MSERSPEYPGYPTTRLRLDLPDELPLDGITLPDGPWEHNNNPPPSPEQTDAFTAQGYAVDALGRPLHPWAHSLLRGEGAVVGKGFYWNWGPNKTADPIVLTAEEKPRILLITRSDTGALALPGGFVDAHEDARDAAVREAHEETGLALATAGELVYSGPVADKRTTLHAWAETSAYLFHVDNPTPVHGADDALHADWYPIDELPDTLFGSHAALVQMALELKTQKPSLQDILAVPETERVTTIIEAGHMAYDHLVTRHNDTEVFIKTHVASKFDDPRRELHSRAYLEKEAAYYAHLLEHGSSFIPERVALIDGTTLAMDYLSNERGWHWRAPQESITNYITDALSSFSELQSLKTTPPTHEAISPTYETLWREGWDTLDDTTLERITQRLTQLSAPWTTEQQRAAQRLVEALPDLRTQALGLNRDMPLFPSHNDARQSNIAWHPEHGVTIVDWSWADHAPKDADATMFLIDLHKSGHSVEAHMSSFNADHALILIGFWAAHSTWQTRDGTDEVRAQQAASATAAFELLERHH